MLRRSMWGNANTTLPLVHSSSKKKGDVLLPVRDGIRLVVSAFLGVERDRFPYRVDPNVRSGVQVCVHHTPFGKVPTLYFFFDTHQTYPFVWEQCLHYSALFKDKDPFTLVTGLIRQMMVENYLYLVPFDMQNGQVLINRKHPIDATLRKQLTDAAVGLADTFSMQTDANFLQAVNWISANFDMKLLQWGPETQRSPSTGERPVTTEVVEQVGLNRNIGSLGPDTYAP